MIRASRLLVRVAMSTSALLSASCTVILGLDDKPLAADAGSPGAGDGSRDTGRADVATRDAGAPCRADDAGYHDQAVASCWETWDIAGNFSTDRMYLGAAYDGRYVYFVADLSYVLRYDTQGAFTASSSWTQFDTSDLPSAEGEYFQGLVFDGRYLYVVPDDEFSLMLRYDTHAAFSEDASWETYSLNPGTGIAYAGGTFDGRYVYFSPNLNYSDGSFNGSPAGAVARYDTTKAFASDAAWSSFDTTTLGGALAPNASAYYGALYDGRYVYLPPSTVGSGIAARYDTTASFDAATSWSLVDLTEVDGETLGYMGGMFDGRSIILVPAFASSAALALDVMKPFTASSWLKHVPAADAGAAGVALNAATFHAGAFDGRFLYDVPGPLNKPEANGLLVREDTVGGGFTNLAEWTSFDTNDIHASTFGAAVFDGKYLYLAPLTTSRFARFDARETKSQPALPHYFGSFF